MGPAFAECLGVNDEKHNQPQARDDHRRRSERLAAGVARALFLRIRDRPGRVVVDPHLDRLVDVNEEDEQQQDLDDRQQRIAFHDERVAVEDARTEEHQQVSGDVNKEVTKKCEAGDADEELRPD